MKHAYNRQMMIQIPSNHTAVGFEAVVETLRTQLGVLSWLDYTLPRAKPHSRLNNLGRVTIYPNVPRYKAQSATYDYFSAEPVERTNYCFFLWQNERENSEGFATCTMSIIFYIDLRKIQTNKNIESLIKEEVKRVLENPTQRSFILENITVNDNSFKEVWREFNLPDVNMQYMSHPFYSVRFDFEVTAPANCELITYTQNKC